MFSKNISTTNWQNFYKRKFWNKKPYSIILQIFEITLTYYNQKNLFSKKFSISLKDYPITLGPPNTSNKILAF